MQILNELLQLFTNIINHTDFVISLGLMLATATILGGMLDPNWKDYRIWTLIMGIFVVYQCWIFSALLHDTITTAEQIYVISIRVVVAVLFLIGLGLGAWIVKKSKAPYKKRHAELENILEELKQENGKYKKE